MSEEKGVRCFLGNFKEYWNFCIIVVIFRVSLQGCLRCISLSSIVRNNYIQGLRL